MRRKCGKWKHLESKHHVLNNQSKKNKEKRRKRKKEGWSHGSEVKSTGYSSRGPEFNSQQPYGGSQPSVMRSGALF